jgi:hypothetical protein
MDLNLKEMTFIVILDGDVSTFGFDDWVAARVAAISASEDVLNPTVQIKDRLVINTDPGSLVSGRVRSKLSG